MSNQKEKKVNKRIEKMQQFRCYALKKNEHWYAACIDLNLVDRAETLDTVVNKLKENIQLYIQDKDVVPFRSAPLSYQFQYQWILFKSLVFSWFQKQSNEYYSFIELWDGRLLKPIGA